MNKQEILEQIDELKQKIEVLEKEVNSPEFEGVKKGVREMPQYEERYCYIAEPGEIISTPWYGTNNDIFRFNTGNCFKTEQEAKDYKENLLTKQALKDLALELNKGIEVNWEDAKQLKYFIYYENKDCILYKDDRSVSQSIGQVYCLNENFLTIAKDRIGEEKLIKLTKSGV